MRPHFRSIAVLLLTISSCLLAAASTPIEYAWQQPIVIDQTPGPTGQAASCLDVAGAEYEAIGSSDGYYSYWNIYKLDRYGNADWSQVIEFPGESTPVAIKVDGSSNVLVAGNIGNGQGSTEVALAKMSSTGSPMWIRNFQPSTDVQTETMAIGFDSSNDIFVGCRSEPTTAHDYRFFSFGEYDPTGHLLTSKENQDLDLNDNDAVAFNQSGNMLIWGIDYQSNTGGAIFELLSPAGTVLASEKTEIIDYNTGEIQYGYHGTFDSAGNYYIGENVVNIPNQGTTTATHDVRAFSAGSSLLWTSNYTSGGLEQIQATDTSHVALLSYISSTEPSLLEMLGAQGQLLWNHAFTSFSAGMSIDGVDGVEITLVSKAGSGYLTLFQKYLPNGTADWFFQDQATNAFLPFNQQFQGNLFYLSTTTSLGASIQTVSEGLAISKVSFSPATVTAGGMATGTVSLTEAAPIGGFTVTLAVSNPAVVSVPSTVNIPAGASSATFSALVSNVDSVQPILVFATCSQTSRSASLTANPAPLTSISAPSTITGTTTATGTVTLTGDTAYAGRWITLVSNNPSVASVPSSVYISPGTKSATFQIKTTAPKTATAVVLAGSSDGATVKANVTVQP